MTKPKTYRTKTGRVLTDAEIAALAEEQGRCQEHALPRRAPLVARLLQCLPNLDIDVRHRSSRTTAS